MEGITRKDASLFAIYAQDNDSSWQDIAKKPEEFLSCFSSPQAVHIAKAMLAVKTGQEAGDRKTALIAIGIFEWAWRCGIVHFSHICSRHTNSEHDKMRLALDKDKKMIEEAKKKYSA